MSFTESLDDLVTRNENRLLSIQPSWTRVRLGEVASVLNGFAFSSSAFSQVQGKPLLRIRDVLDTETEAFYTGRYLDLKDFRPQGIPIIFLRHVAAGRYLTHKPGFMDRQKWETLFRPYSVFGGELLITKLGEPPGVCAIYPEDLGPAMVTPDVIKISVNKAVVLPKFLMHFLNSDKARSFSNGACFGTTRLRLTLPLFRRMPVALPSLAGQERILTEVERQLSD